MGRIIKNGITYGGPGASSSANKIVFNNAKSGLKSTNVQDAIDELKTGLSTSVPPVVTLTNETEVDEYFNSVSAEVETRSFYRRIVNLNVNHSIIGAGMFILEGFRSGDYGWQNITSYSFNSNGYTRHFERTLYSSVWGPWIDTTVGVGKPNAGYHNAIYRGKDVTGYYEDGSLYTRISNGTFEDLYVGDYIVRSDGNIDRIMGFDLFLNSGDGNGLTLSSHHAVIVPDRSYTTSPMNSENTSEGGYIGSYMWKTTLPSVLETYITPNYGSHVLTYRSMLTNSIEDNGVGSYGLAHGVTSDWEWADTTVDLMSEINVYGSNVWSSAGFDTGIKNMVFPGFSMNPLLKVINREDFWLSNVCTGSSFCFCVNNGRSDHGEAGRAFAVRPFFLIG